MAETTKIRWTESTWNPATGCTAVSPGCDNCYAQRIAENRKGPAFPNGFAMTLRPHRLNEPRKWKEPRRIFVNSMSDLFHKDIPDDYLRAVWDTMVETPRHTYQVLTKRAHRMAHKVATLGLPLQPHIWLGVSAENQAMADSRIPPLLDTRPAVAFVSAEPLLGPVDLGHYIDRLQWVIVGGESGSGRRPMDYDWARALRDQCNGAGVAFFYKQGNAHVSDRDVTVQG